MVPTPCRYHGATCVSVLQDDGMVMERWDLFTPSSRSMEQTDALTDNGHWHRRRTRLENIILGPILDDITHNPAKTAGCASQGQNYAPSVSVSITAQIKEEKEDPALFYAPSPSGGEREESGEINWQDGDGASATCATDSLALEAGRSAYEYLEECFCTEASVLDREKFDAVPEITNSDFTVLGRLGKGNFSDVFEVVCEGGKLSDTKAPQLVFALKCLHPPIQSHVEEYIVGAEDLVHETAILANLDHHHIIKMHGRASGHLAKSFLLNDGYFILLDRLEETLCDRIDGWKRDPGLVLRGPINKQMDVVHSIAVAMCYLHSRKIIFRDLKPANVGFDSRGVMKLFDFGFAAGLPEKDRGNPSGHLYDRCGTPRYMAPEVALSFGYGLPADVYSFGILLWEICALAHPFSSIQTPDEFERLVFKGGKRPAVKSSWPAVVKALMSSCWSADPNERPTMFDIKSVLSLAMSRSLGGRC